ncbi:MAG TPA: anti-sigma factor [Accumulibacter sp.]|nr:anti-sigma factor [Accumulibacter sp.]HMW17511.1 anti-sigma factor [Accumulibacter sp.]HMX21833.1 anti-sigma factor [Accumulibacter sp.]HMY07602.1 anti-sigma factor [Accumulibacter sp.]HNC17655.1 anti-sigma factor [Accumulibacter sp.]
MNDTPITDADLHAYVDGELAADRQAQVAAWLANQPAAAARVLAYQTQKQDLRELFDPVLDEPWPESWQQYAASPPPAAASPWRPRFDRSWSGLAAGCLLTLAGGTAGWLAHAHFQPPTVIAQTVPLARQAAVAHAVFSPDIRRPVEISAEHEEQLVTWLSKRLGAAVRPAKLGPLGYELIGGRLLPGNSGPVAQFMYHDASGQRLTLYVSTENVTNRETAFRFETQEAVNVFYWIDGKFGYALSATVSKDELARLARAVHEQFESR